MKTPIKPGDPIWFTTPGEQQAQPGVLVSFDSGVATIQLLSEPAGVHGTAEAGRVSYRSGDGKQPPPSPAPEPEPAPATVRPPDAFDQLVALFPKVVARLEDDLVEARGRREVKRKELVCERKAYDELRRLRALQIRRLRSALIALTRPRRSSGSGGGSNADWWTPERRAAQGERARRQNLHREKTT